MFESSIETDRMSKKSILLIKTSLDLDLFDKISKGQGVGGLTDRIADKIVEQILPEMEQRILSDPLFKNRIIGDILIRIANRLSDKGLLEGEIKQE